MKYFICLLIGLCSAFSSMCSVNAELEQKFSQHDFSKVKTVSELSAAMSDISQSQDEYLELLLLWTNKYMRIDSTRFFLGGPPLSCNESIRLKTGLCDEFSNILVAYCKAAGITSIRIEGYVKESSFTAGYKFEQTNHAWNAVFIDSTWKLCDLFWSVVELKNDKGLIHFEKRLNDKYFLCQPSSFAFNHLPVIPLFQFTEQPVNVDEFITNDFAVNPPEVFHFRDSLVTFLKLSEGNKDLYIAPRSYDYNRSNPNTLIAVYYNRVVEIVGNGKSSVSDLKIARAYLQTISPLIPTSSVPGVLALAAPAKEAEHYIEKVLKTKKG